MSQNSQAPSPEPSDIFINYRRADTSGYAGRLEQELNRRFPGQVFMDIHTIEVGTDFAEAINSEVGKCGVLIVLIGNQWLDITDPKTGKRRLENPNDFVAIEISEALKRNVRVIPVLVEGAKMPEADELPASLAALTRRNAIEITDTRWDYDVQQLINVLEKICSATPLKAPAGNEALTGNRGALARWGAARIAILSTIGALVVAAAVFALLRRDRHRELSPNNSGQPAAAVVAPKMFAGNSNKTDSDGQAQAIVNPSAAEAEFFFPFDTTGRDWKWGLEETKVDGEEYRWDVTLEDGPKKYDIELLEQKAAGEDPKRGALEDVLNEVEPGLWWLAIGNGSWEEQPKMTFKHEVFPNGLKLTVSGKGIQTIFAKRPKKASLRMKTPKMRETEVFPPVRIEYKDDRKN